MTYALITLAFLGVLWFLDRRDTRNQAIALEAIGALEREREKERAELQTVLQRVQAPQLAVADHSATHSLPTDPVLPQTDEEAAEFEQSRLAAELAEQAMQQMQADENAFMESLAR